MLDEVLDWFLFGHFMFVDDDIVCLKFFSRSSLISNMQYSWLHVLHTLEELANNGDETKSEVK